MHPWRNVLSNPDPDHDVAQYVARKIGGGATIIYADKPDFVEGRGY